MTTMANEPVNSSETSVTADNTSEDEQEARTNSGGSGAIDTSMANPADQRSYRNPKPDWPLSKKKILKARVYAEYPKNQQAYWGNIVGLSGSYRTRDAKFNILFEDGDFEPDLESSHIMTEEKYVQVYNEYPPRPMPDAELDALLAEGKRLTAKPRPDPSAPDAVTVPSAKRQKHNHRNAADLLVGRGYVVEWTDLQGKSLHLFGKIVECLKKDESDRKYVVHYSDQSLEFVKSIRSTSALGLTRAIEKRAEISQEDAYGGCVAFEKKTCLFRTDSIMGSLSRETRCVHKVVADAHVESMVEYKGRQVPQLMLIFRGYKLVFSVKQSTIPGAGLGVFLKASCMCAEGTGSGDFPLKPGEWLDLGVYAPTRPSDVVPEAVFNIKTYLFSMKTEHYSFSAKSHGEVVVHDISDHKTAEMHEEAKRHILPYFNENVDSIQTIHAFDDPEGCTHYALGIEYRGDWDDYHQVAQKFQSIVNGQERELYVYYGDSYEEVRIREGYSKLSQEQQQVIMKSSEEHEAEFLADVMNHDADEIEKCVDFLSNHCIPDGYYGVLLSEQERLIDEEVKKRALAMADKLKERSTSLLGMKTEASAAELHVDLTDVIGRIDSFIDRLKKLKIEAKVDSSTAKPRLDLDRDSQDGEITASVGTTSKVSCEVFIDNVEKVAASSSSSSSSSKPTKVVEAEAEAEAAAKAAADGVLATGNPDVEPDLSFSDIFLLL